MDKTKIAFLAQERIAELMRRDKVVKNMKKKCKNCTYSPDGGKTRLPYNDYFKGTNSLLADGIDYSDEMLRELTIELKTAEFNSSTCYMGYRKGSRLNMVNEFANRMTKNVGPMSVRQLLDRMDKSDNKNKYKNYPLDAPFSQERLLKVLKVSPDTYELYK